MSATTIACIGLGGNLGDVRAAIAGALHELDTLPQTRLRRASRLYRTRAWGVEAQPDFINAAAVVETGLDARALLDELLLLERAHGRERSAELRWGPRTLDLDLLLYGDAVIDEPGLRVPHPHLHERAFALLPLAEIAAERDIPGIGRIGPMAAAMADAGVEALG